MVALILGTTDQQCQWCNETEAEIIVGDKQLCKPCLETIVAGMDSIRIDAAYTIRQLRQFRDCQRALDAVERIAETVETVLKVV